MVGVGIMLNSTTIGITGIISSVFGGILAIFGIKKQISTEIKGCFKPELEKLDSRIKRLEGIDVLTITAHEKICSGNEKLINSELQILQGKIDSTQELLAAKIDNVNEKVTSALERMAG